MFLASNQLDIFNKHSVVYKIFDVIEKCASNMPLLNVI